MLFIHSYPITSLPARIGKVFRSCLDHWLPEVYLSFFPVPGNNQVPVENFFELDEVSKKTKS